MENRKKIIMVVLSVLVCVMAVGYAVLAQQLNINGTASIDSRWDIQITNITEKDIVGDATSKITPSYTATTANFSVGLIQPGDSITYDIEVSNLGTLKAKVDSINIVMDNNDAIVYTVSGIEEGDKLGVGEKDTLTIKVEYNSEVTSQPAVTTKDIAVVMNYVQDFGSDTEVNPSPAPEYKSYSTGDIITFAGSNWYVIKDSASDEDYVTLFKEKVLSSIELGEYAAVYTDVCQYADVYTYKGRYGCTVAGKNANFPTDTMEYYMNDTCYYDRYYGYTSTDSSGCSGHNDYEGSKVREFLEEKYINTLGADNLKEVDNYKIRLITLDELQNNLGYSTELKATGYGSSEFTPAWVYSNFGEKTDRSNGVYRYWTMTTDQSHSGRVFGLNLNSKVSVNVVYVPNAVRPVINLLKSSIQ